MAPVSLHDVVVLTSAACVRLLIGGLWFTPGILYVAFLDEFRHSSGVTSWITTLQYFSSSIMCVFGGLLVRRVGCRVVILSGGLVLSAGLLSSMWASHIAHIFITYALLSGLGSGLAYIGIMEALNIQITRLRNVLFGVCAFTGNMGVMVYPPLLQVLIDHYTWRGMFFVLAGLELNVAALSLIRVSRRRGPGEEKTASTEGEAAEHKLLEKERDIDRGDGKPVDELLDTDKHHLQSSNSVEVKVIYDTDDRGSGFLEENSFLKDVHYYLYILSGAVYLFGNSIVMGHLSAYVVSHHLTDKLGASMMYTVNVMTMALGKLMHGFVLGEDRLQPAILHALLTGVGGLASFVFLLKLSLPVMYGYVVVFGVSSSAIGGALMPAMTLQMSGGRSFAFALGLAACGTAVGSLLGAPAAGWILDITHSYKVPFLVAAITMTSSSAVMLASMWLKKASCTCVKS